MYTTRLYIALLLSAGITSCTTLNIRTYYNKHQSALDSIETVFRQAYQKKTFCIGFTDRPFDQVSLSLITDTLTYIYEFPLGVPRLQDSLVKYGYDTVPVNSLISNM